VIATGQHAVMTRVYTCFNCQAIFVCLQIRPSFTGASGAPLILKSYWKHDTLRADFQLDYAYNALAFSPSQKIILSDLSILVPVSGYVTKMQCKPPGSW